MNSIRIGGPKIIYIAGPYRADTRHGVLMNIHVAREAALDVWELGHAALCPHSNSAFFGGARGIPDRLWYVGDLEMLRRCDGLYLVGDWEHSEGTLREIELAKELQIPVYYTKEQMVRALGDLDMAGEWPL